MRITPINNTSFGKLVIDDKDGKTTEALSLLIKRADMYDTVKSTFDKIDKNTGSDTVILSGSTKKYRGVDTCNHVDAYLTIKNAKGEEINTLRAYNADCHNYPSMSLKTADGEYNKSFYYDDGMAAFADIPGYKPSSESIKYLASQYIK